MLRLENVSVHQGRRAVVRGVNLTAAPGTLTVLIGPNGAGKSSLLRGILGVLPRTGRVEIAGRDLAGVTRGEAGRLMGYVPQDLVGRSTLTVLEVVLLGRLDSLGWHVARRDLDAALDELEGLGLASLAARPIDSLSGGQRQLVFVGQALAREPAVLLLDEPTSALDPRHQLTLLSTLRDIAATRAIAIVMALHDLNLALRFADQALVLHDGAAVAAGPTREVVTVEMVARVFGVEALPARLDGGPNALISVRALPDHSRNAT